VLKAAAGPNPDPKSDDDDDDSSSEGAAVIAESTTMYEEEGGTFPVPVFPYAGLVSTSSKATREARLPHSPLPVSVPDLTKKSRVQREPEPADAQQRAHVCVVPECSKSFTSVEHLERHVLSLHTNEKCAFPFPRYCTAK
jgi:hypothetical protein